MADGRTLQRWLRLYQNGYDLSSDTLSVGPLVWDYGYEEQRGLNWAVAGGLCERATIQTGTVNTLLRTTDDPTTSPHDIIKGMDGQAVVQLIAVGVRAEPAAGDPAWCAAQLSQSKVTPPTLGMVTGTIAFQPDVTAGMNYDRPWGVLLHAKGARTAANTAAGLDGGAATTGGGYIVAQVFAVAGEGTVTIKCQSAATNLNANFADVTGLTLDFAHTAVPGAAIAQAATTATINRYTRYQLVFDGITSVTFALALVRGR
jgi:hypothetical protein